MSQNSCSDIGGGFFLYKSVISTITDVTFLKNTAGNSGGAIFVGGESGTSSSMTVTRCTFQENEQLGTSTSSYYGGGAVTVYKYTTVHIRESTFFKNKAENERGHQLKPEDSTSSSSLINTQFVNCDTCTSNNLEDPHKRVKFKWNKLRQHMVDFLHDDVVVVEVID